MCPCNVVLFGHVSFRVSLLVNDVLWDGTEFGLCDIVMISRWCFVCCRVVIIIQVWCVMKPKIMFLDQPNISASRGHDLTARPVSWMYRLLISGTLDLRDVCVHARPLFISKILLSKVSANIVVLLLSKTLLKISLWKFLLLTNCVNEIHCRCVQMSRNPLLL